MPYFLRMMLFRAFSGTVPQFKPKNAKFSADSAPNFYKLICELFGMPRRPHAHVVCFEALEHIASPYMAKGKGSSAFPAMMQDYTIHKNITLLHFSMIAQRFVSFKQAYEETREAQHQHELLFDLCDKYIFERYLDISEPLLDVPVTEFECELVEMLSKDFLILYKSLACWGYEQPYLILDSRETYNLQSCLYNEFFDGRVRLDDPQVSRLQSYFHKNRKMLENMSYLNFIHNEVNWRLDSEEPMSSQLE
mmetsp:Transcript_13361/g.25099  ORF Transcript_13361/g.25099 Transcript_13361/m.25099 type:complete len:250 (-) Transcript_13361:639-1388(-)